MMSLHSIFLNPEYLWLLLVLPILVGLKLWADSRAANAVKVFAAPRLQADLVSHGFRFRSWLRSLLEWFGLACLILAVARPYWGEEQKQLPERGRNIFIALDTSRSMLAKDVVPDRLTRAKLAALDLVEQLPGERIGLLAVAGRAYLQAPLTTDHSAIVESLLAFDETIIEWGGSNLKDLLEVTLRAIKKLPESNYALIIFSDGGDPDAQLVEKIQEVTKKGIVIATVGVGTEQGAIIPDPENPGDYVRDEAGNVVRTKLEIGVMQQLASATGGIFMRLGTQPLTRQTLAPILNRLREQDATTRQEHHVIERFTWPLSAGIISLMISWLIRQLPRRRAVAASTLPGAALALLTLTLSLPAASEGASLLSSIFGSPETLSQEARRAFEAKDYEGAREKYDQLRQQLSNPDQRSDAEYGYARSAHELKDYDASVQGFSGALQSPDSGRQIKAYRGLSTSLYNQGERSIQRQPKITVQAWQDSLRHIDAALKLDPENKDLQENRAFIASRLKQVEQIVKQMEQQKGKKGQKGDKGQKGEKGKKGEKGEKGEGEGEGDEEGDEEGEGEGDKDGEKKMGEGNKGKDADGGGEKKGENEDGVGGKEQTPEGQIRAVNPGSQPDGDKEGQGEKKDPKGEPTEQRNKETGYTPGEASSYLRQYMDEKFGNIGNKRITPPPNKRNW